MKHKINVWLDKHSLPLLGSAALRSITGIVIVALLIGVMASSNSTATLPEELGPPFRAPGETLSSSATPQALAPAATPPATTTPGTKAANPPASITKIAPGAGGNTPPAAASPTPAPTPPVAPPAAIFTSGNPLSGLSFYVNPNGSAPKAYATTTDPAEKAAVKKIADQPIGTWVVGSTNMSSLGSTLSAARSAGKVPIIVLYNIPKIGCGTGGAASVDAYKTWINGVSGAMGSTKSVVIIEPDSVAMFGCLSAAQVSDRIVALNYAIDTLTKNGNVLYLDAGHSNWTSASTMADRLKQAGVQKVRGISVNVSNFQTDANSASYARQITSKLGGGGIVIDSSRNGAGPSPDNQWCNPPGRKLGKTPQASLESGIDGYLWVKYPGESDGSCNGGTPEGKWWQQYAVGLAS